MLTITTADRDISITVPQGYAAQARNLRNALPQDKTRFLEDYFFERGDKLSRRYPGEPFLVNIILAIETAFCCLYCGMREVAGSFIENACANVHQSKKIDNTIEIQIRKEWERILSEDEV